MKEFIKVLKSYCETTKNKMDSDLDEIAERYESGDMEEEDFERMYKSQGIYEMASSILSLIDSFEKNQTKENLKLTILNNIPATLVCFTHSQNN